MDIVDFGLRPKECAMDPRFGTLQFMNSFGQAPAKLGSVILNSNIGNDVIKALKDRGAMVEAQTSWASPVMIRVDPVTGLIEAGGGSKSRRAGAY